jgi:CheY-like chemotaxis protein
LKISVKDINQNFDLKPGQYLRLEVSDTGHGMDQATQERIFEPYFTTKGKGEGTGMGLSVIHGIVKGIGGHIKVYSTPGKGSTFHIYLPVHESSISQTEIFPEGTVPTGTERILFVDDEETIRSVGNEMLSSLGYNVKVFGSPVEALDFFTAQPDMFDLVITDMTMPKMTGDKLVQEIMNIRPEIPVILCTGFSDLIGEESAKAIGIKEYITKPLIFQTFGRIIRNVLDKVGEQKAT